MLVVSPPTQTVDYRGYADVKCNIKTWASTAATMSWSFKDSTGVTTQLRSSKGLSHDLPLHVQNMDASKAGTYTCEVTTAKETLHADSVLKISGNQIRSSINDGMIGHFSLEKFEGVTPIFVDLRSYTFMVQSES